jgi:hypothetical protein
MGLGDVLISELREQASSFASDELAYLALTSKVEFVVRDRLAFLLHRRLGSDTVTVAREWRRTDLVVFRGRTPELLVELKAMYSFDTAGAGTGLRRFREAVRRDCAKALRHAGAEAEVYALLLVTHPETTPSGLEHVIKYYRPIVRSASAGMSMVRSSAVAAIVKAFSGAPLAVHDTWPAGSAFGIPVSIDYWLFGPYRSAVTDDPPGAAKAGTARGKD